MLSWKRCFFSVLEAEGAMCARSGVRGGRELAAERRDSGRRGDSVTGAGGRAGWPRLRQRCAWGRVGRVQAGFARQK